MAKGKPETMTVKTEFPLRPNVSSDTDIKVYIGKIAIMLYDHNSGYASFKRGDMCFIRSADRTYFGLEKNGGNTRGEVETHKVYVIPQTKEELEGELEYINLLGENIMDRLAYLENTKKSEVNEIDFTVESILQEIKSDEDTDSARSKLRKYLSF
jgi:hypothetical protein